MLPSKKQLKQLANYLVETVIPDCPAGFTMNPYNREFPLFLKDQYVVALKEYEKRLLYPIKIGEVFSWLCTNAHAFENRFVGGWHDSETNEYVLDVSIAITGEQEAKDFGLLNTQTHIYSQYFDKEIPLTEKKAA